MTLADSPAVFAVKCLLFPAIAMLALVSCLMIAREPFKGGYFLIAVLTFIGTTEFVGLARIGASEARQLRRYVLLDLTVRWFALMIVVAMVLYLCGLIDSLKRGPLIVWSTFTPVTLYVAQRIARYWLTRAPLQGKLVRRAVIVGMTELGVRLEKVLRADALLRTEVDGYFEDRSVERLSANGLSPILNKVDALAQYVASHNIEQVYITLPMKPDQRVLSMLDALHDSTASIYFVPDLVAFNLIQARFDTLSGIPIIAVRETPFYGAAWLVKRVSDVSIASLGILIALPLLIAVAVCIRLDTPGPIFFKQKRYGLDGREILVYKFRSMRVTEDGKSQYKAASRHDSRVTKVGAYIRKTSLDELPQLFNVLEGSMSIVGPRPHPVAMNEHYRRAIPSYMVRHKVKPGITGWAQVNGYRGGDDLESMRGRIEFDLAYVRHWSLWLDFKILIKTVLIVWTDSHAY